jgi:hypothetical protein
VTARKVQTNFVDKPTDEDEGKSGVVVRWDEYCEAETSHVAA